MNAKTDIQHRTHIRLLVETFYSKIRVHDDLGPIFNAIITDWDGHFELLTDFVVYLLMCGYGVAIILPF